MLKYSLRRLALIVPMMLLVTFMLFILIELAPYDAAVSIAGETASQEQIEALRQELGLDRPWWERFGESVSELVRGDLGESYRSGEGVMTIITRYLPTSLWLAAYGLVLSLLIGVSLGILAAVRQGGLIDRAVSAFSALTLALPPFVLGAVLVVFFALTLGWFPATGFKSPGDGLSEFFRSATLPAVALAAIPTGELARHTRGSMVDVLDQDYVRTARSKGLLERTVVAKHVAKNAAIPVLTVLGLIMGRVLAGSVTVEFVFGINGVGRLAYDSAQLRDVPVLQGIVLLGALSVLLINLLVDISYSYFNPRLRSQ